MFSVKRLVYVRTAPEVVLVLTTFLTVLLNASAGAAARDNLERLLRNVDPDRPLLGVTSGNVAETALVLTFNLLDNGDIKFSETVTSVFNSSDPGLSDKLGRLKQKQQQNQYNGRQRLRHSGPSTGEWSHVRSNIASTSNNVAVNAIYLTVNLMLAGSGQGEGSTGFDGLHGQCPVLGQERRDSFLSVQNNVASTSHNTAENGIFVTMNLFLGNEKNGLRKREDGGEEIIVRLPVDEIIQAIPVLRMIADKLNLDNFKDVFPWTS